MKPHLRPVAAAAVAVCTTPVSAEPGHAAGHVCRRALAPRVAAIGGFLRASEH